MAQIRIATDAVKAHLDMKWGVIVNQIVRPIALIGLAVPLALAGLGPIALAWAWLGSQVLCVPLAVYGYSRYFRLAATLRAVPGCWRDPEVLAFAGPQSLNMLFSNALSRLDTLMLSGYCDTNTIGLYGLASEYLRPIREAKRTFVGVFAPLVAGYNASGNRAGIAESLATVSRWTAAAGVPLAIGLLAFYPEYTQQELGRAWPLSPLVPWLLALGPLLSSFTGLSGNLLLMTGHTRMLLLNSGAGAALNVGLNRLLIPVLGPVGAAIGTAGSLVATTLLQVVEMRKVEQVGFDWSVFRRPLVGLIVLAPVVAWVTSPSGHALVYGPGPAAGLGLKVALVVALLGAYAGILFGWPGDRAEWRSLRDKLRARG
jgi:O-antigen/teichoic acid export membrane protein